MSEGMLTMTVDSFPDEILVSKEFLEQCDPAFMQRVGDCIDIRVTNGGARYQIIGTSCGGKILHATRRWFVMVKVHDGATV